uniref:hypothetical protein n=1 Tax=Legionella tunisiensis TaxID=1034944 RepID=UPI000594AB70
VFLKDGGVNLAKLEELSPLYTVGRVDNERDKIEPFKRQCDQITQSWLELTKEQVAIKKALDEQENLSDEEFTILKQGLEVWQLDLSNGEQSLVDEILQKGHWDELEQTHREVIGKVLAQKQWKELTSEQLEIVKEVLIEKQKQNVAQALEWYDSKLLPWHREYVASCHNEAMDNEAEKSFPRRNAGSLASAVISLFLVISTILILTGVLSPLGLTLGFITTIVTAVVGGVAAITAGASAVKMGMDENKLSTYQQELETAEEPPIDSLQRKLAVINPHIDISRLKKEEITVDLLQNMIKVDDLSNDSEAVRRAILGANFSEEEFAELFKTVQEALLVDEDVLVEVDEFAELQSQIDEIVHVPEGSLVDIAQNAVKNVPTGVSSSDVAVTKKKEEPIVGEDLVNRVDI